MRAYLRAKPPILKGFAQVVMGADLFPTNTAGGRQTGQQLGGRNVQNGVKPGGGDFGQRGKDEGPLVEARMGQKRCFFALDQGSIGQKVEIEGSGPVFDHLPNPAKPGFHPMQQGQRRPPEL